MKSTDLRIGNYVYYEHTTHIVSGIHGNKVYSWWVKDGEPVIEYEAKDISGTQVENPYIDVISHYEPIPLTEEWLLKFEFKQYETIGIKTHNYIKGNFKFNSAVLWVAEYKGVHIENKILYVHQLQNLYFALIGEELQLK